MKDRIKSCSNCTLGAFHLPWVTGTVQPTADGSFISLSFTGKRKDNTLLLTNSPCDSQWVIILYTYATFPSSEAPYQSITCKYHFARHILEYDCYFNYQTMQGAYGPTLSKG